MLALLTGREDRSRALDWIQIGSIAGPTMALPCAALRSTNLRVMGSGQGSVAAKAIVAELPRLTEEILAGQIPVDVQRVALAEVEQAWTASPPPSRRVVLVP